ncbi:MAG: hypothetical protein ACLFPL_04230 [Candidatus Nanoarchaeia archaeon]
MYHLIISKSFKKKFDKLPRNIQTRAKKLLEELNAGQADFEEE